MFRCELCGKISNSKEPANKVVISKRPRSYHYYKIKTKTSRGKNIIIIAEKKPDFTDKNVKLLKEFDSKGWEIVEEKLVCKECADEHEQDRG